MQDFNFDDYTFGGHCVSIKFLEEEIHKQLMEQTDPEKHKRYRTVLANFLDNDNWHEW